MKGCNGDEDDNNSNNENDNYDDHEKEKCEATKEEYQLSPTAIARRNIIDENSHSYSPTAKNIAMAFKKTHFHHLSGSGILQNLVPSPEVMTLLDQWGMVH